MSGTHRAARTHSRAAGIARWAVPLVLTLLALAYWHGTQVQAQQQQQQAVHCTAEDMQTLHAEQEWRVSHPDAPHNVMPCEPTGNGTGAFPTWADGVAACQEEDGSTPGQPFPCRWEAAEQGNRHGATYTLAEPAGEMSP